MNKFKLALLALITAGVVGCGGGGGGGGGTAGDDNETTPVASSGAGDENGTTPVLTATGTVVSDSGIPVTPTFIPSTGRFNTLTLLKIDLNKDGVNDVVKFRGGGVSGYDNLYIEALINNGDGASYTDQTSKYFGNIGNNYTVLHDVYLADLNDDGLDDILSYTGCWDDSEGNHKCLPPMIQQADGSFEITTNPLLQTMDGGYMPTDLDGDGDMDILQWNQMPDNNAFVPGWPGGGRWGGDDMDRREWIVFENRSENGVAKFVEHYDVVKNTPEGVGDLYGAMVHFSEVADINGDGHLDILTGGTRWVHDENGGGFTETPGKLAVYLGNGDYTFTYSRESWVGDEAEANHAYRAHTADYDGDGDPDFAIAVVGYDGGTYDGEQNFMLWNTNGKLYKDTGTSTTHDYMGFTHQSAIADVDNDGDTDVVYWDLGGADVRNACGGANSNSNTMRVLKNNGTGGFTGNIHCLMPYQRADGSYKSYWTVAMTMADMNGDGFVDILTGENNEFGEDRVVFNNGDGTFNLDIITTVN